MRTFAAAIALLVLSLACPASAAPERKLAVVALAGSSCPDASALVDKLREELPRWTIASRGKGDVLSAVVELEKPGTLAVKLIDHGRLVEQRSIDFQPQGCVDLPRTIALIVKLWVRALPGLRDEPPEPKSTRGATQPSATAPEEPKPEPIIAPPEMPSLTPAIPEHPPVVTVAPSPHTTKPAPIVVAVDAPKAVPRVEVAEPAPPPLPTTTSPSFFPPLHLELLAGGGGLASLAGDLAPTAGLRIDLGLGEHFGLELHGAWDGALHGTGDGGSVSISRQVLALQLRAMFHPRSVDSSRILVLAGPALQHVSGRGSDLPGSSTQSSTDLGAELGALWAQDLASDFAIAVGPWARLWTRADVFYVSLNNQPETIYRTPRVWLGAEVSVTYRVF